MTEDQAMKKMEGAIGELMRGNQNGPQAIKPAAPNLDAGRLMELARDRLAYAREKLLEIRREHQMKLFEIDAMHARRLREAQTEREAAIHALEAQTALSAKPAADMIALVERMLG
jgi:hypothetical protein